MELIVWIILLTLITVIFQWRTLRTCWYFRKLSGPKGFWATLEIAQLKPHEILDYIEHSLLAKYPRILALWIGVIPIVLLQEPEDIGMLLGNVSHIPKGEDYKFFQAWLKEGLLTSRGQKWQTRRKIFTPSFHFRVLKDSLQSMNQNAEIFAKRLLQFNGNSISIEPLVTLCTLDVLAESVMGVTIGAQNGVGREYVNSIHRMSNSIIRRELSLWLHNDLMFYLSPTGFEFRGILKELHNFVDKVINERKKSFISSKSQNEVSYEEKKVFNKKTRRVLLDTMLEYEENNPNSFTKEDIREEVDTFMFAGHDTTASAVTFTLFLLGTHKDVQAKAVAELFQIFGDSGRAIGMEDLSKMKYLDNVIKESLRMYPSVPLFTRNLSCDLKLKDGVIIPAGTNVAVIPYFLHRNPRVFPDGEKFDPDRFYDWSKRKSYHPYGYIPFSAGPRNCIGQKFAMMEMKIILATILRRAHLESITKTEDLKLVPQMILRPLSDILIKVTPRESLSSTIH